MKNKNHLKFSIQNFKNRIPADPLQNIKFKVLCALCSHLYIYIFNYMPFRNYDLDL